MEKELGTTYEFIGGNNPTRIGASCSILEHKFQKGVPLTRIMFDLGMLIAPEGTEVDVVIPDVREYLGTETHHPEIKLDAIFISHGHEDHLGGYVRLAQAGYTFPPTYASKETLEMLKTFLKEAGVDLTTKDWENKFIEIKSGQTVKFNGVEVEAISMSHTTSGTLGFHSLTTINGEVETGILHPGDYNLRNVIVGEGFNKEAIEDLVRRKPVTHVILDSTSTGSSNKNMISYDEGYKNYIKIFQQHSEKQIFTPVISGSVQNWGNILRAAKATGRKVYIDGYRLGLVFQAMQNAGMHEFDDVVFTGDVNKYLELPASERLVLFSGAMGEEHSGLYKLAQQEKVKSSPKDKDSTKNKTKKNKAKKTGHPYFTIDDNTLLVLSQRGIKELSFNELAKYANVISSLGATVIITEADDLLGKFQTERLQGSGHACSEETLEFLLIVVNAQYNDITITCIPTHGNTSQLLNTAKIAEKAGLKFFIAMNSNVLKLTKNDEKQTTKLDDHIMDHWIGVCEVSDNTSPMQEYIYVLVDTDFKKQGTPFKHIVRKKKFKKYNKSKSSPKDVKDIVKKRGRFGGR